MTYWFVFYKGSILLRKLSDGSFSLPMADGLPPFDIDHLHILYITPMSDGNEC